MAEILQTIGDYQITSKKIDKYTPYWTCITGVSGFFGAMVWLFINIYSSIGGEIPPEWGFGRILLIGISLILFFGSLAYDHTLCGGISITLKGTGTNLTTNFALSNDADRDAKKIKKIMDRYVNFAHHLNAEQNAKELSKTKHEQECCTRYKDVIQKVKKE